MHCAQNLPFFRESSRTLRRSRRVLSSSAGRNKRSALRRMVWVAKRLTVGYGAFAPNPPYKNCETGFELQKRRHLRSRRFPEHRFDRRRQRQQLRVIQPVAGDLQSDRQSFGCR